MCVTIFMFYEFFQLLCMTACRKTAVVRSFVTTFVHINIYIHSYKKTVSVWVVFALYFSLVVTKAFFLLPDR